MKHQRGCLILIVTILLSTSLALAGPAFEKRASGEVEFLQQGADRTWCPLCGMDLRLFYKTSHALRVGQGQWRQVCSIHCLAEDMAHRVFTRTPAIRVIDAASEKWIDAHSAFYVVDSDVPGTMSRMSKIAFARKADAAAFMKRHGGKRVSFEEALRLARKQLAADKKTLRARKKLKMLPAGKKLFSRRCPRQPHPKGTVAQIKTALVSKGSCPGLEGKQLQMVALYLHAQQLSKVTSQAIPVPEGVKCPVCGMFVAKYPDWSATAQSGAGKTYYFDGAKDLFKFLLEPKRWGADPQTSFDRIQVTHYYSRGALDARQAFFVIGSDVLGPMGHELVPLADENEAGLFLREHHGEKILRFPQVDLKLLKALDGRK